LKVDVQIKGPFVDQFLNSIKANQTHPIVPIESGGNVTVKHIGKCLKCGIVIIFVFRKRLLTGG
jgi:hypothetical protein